MSIYNSEGMESGGLTVKSVVPQFISNDGVKEFILEWNVKFPIDKWWRKKYNIPFGSRQHLEMSIFDMKLEWEEDKIYNRISEDTYVFDSGDYLKEDENRTLSEEDQFEQFKKEAASINLSDYND